MKNTFFDKKTVVVIGFGRFGKLLVHLLSKHTRAKIVVLTKEKPITALSKADIVIPCVPISMFETVIKDIAPLLKKGAVVIDICSVKIMPVAVMKKYIPASIQIIATHPMFGPDSYRIKKKLNEMVMVVHNVRAKKQIYEDIKDFFSSLKLNVIDMSPKEHDKFMAYSLGYSYFLGKISQAMHIKKTPIDTYDFELLLEHMNIVVSDSDQLFLDMQIYNPFAKEVIKLIKKSFTRIDEKIQLEQNKNDILNS